MKNLSSFFCAIVSALFCLVNTANAQPDGNPGTECTLSDTLLTNKIWLNTGVNYKESDTTLFGCGYGGNTYYTTPNNNVDSFWIVSTLSTLYNPRAFDPSTGFAYTGRYLNVGDNPFILCTKGYPPQDFWSDFSSSGGCFPPISDRASQWLSVYSEGGGQNNAAFDSLGDGYAFERCFGLCSSDSLTFNLKMMADDIIDTVKMDNHYLFVNPKTVNEEFTCDSMITVDTTLFVTAGRHFFTIWMRDIFHGHIALDVYGTITSKGSDLYKPKYDDRCSTGYTEIPPMDVQSVLAKNGIHISPNPSNGSFNVDIPVTDGQSLLMVYDYSGRQISEQNLTAGKNNITLRNTVPGCYLLKIINQKETYNSKIVVE